MSEKWKKKIWKWNLCYYDYSEWSKGYGYISFWRFTIRSKWL